ncbi:MAG: alanine racemase [Acidobacteria bacterium RIFCSPLOWO2_02_FULL_67_21]|nr:MAG: alanine racemase [Acidobacteria bacterium RIFCSPLOWO2_02_FULL_67_21]
MIRSTVARVDLAALQSNFRAIREFLGGPEGGGPAIIAVVKANAYGHGAERVAQALEQAGATMLACADIEEGIVLRRSGVTMPILVFGALSVSDLDGLFEYALTPTISTPSAARAVQAAAARRGIVCGYHLKIDTGMNRLGFRFDNLGRMLPALLNSDHLRLEAAYTHFATADIPEHPLFGEQRSRFEAAVASAGLRVPCHAANSAALLRDARIWYDAVRPGLLLYGIVPPPLASTIPLRPVMSLTSRVVAVKGLRPGEAVGYGSRYVADTPRSIAVVPAGYADGLDTRLSGRGVVLIRGRRVPIVGAVSMDMMTVDVSELEDVQPGDEVVLLGRQGDESWQQIDAREMAAWIGTIPWEIVCRLGTRIERHYE